MSSSQLAMLDAANEFSIEELRDQDLLQSVDLKTIEPVLRDGELRVLRAGEVLIERGKFNRHLYLILTGLLSVRLRTGDRDPMLMLEPGQSVGEFSLIDHKPASASVVAETDSRVLVLDEELMWILVNSSHGFSSNLLFVMVRRLRTGNDLFVQQREELERFKFSATVDPLTGLFNRRWLDTMMIRQMDRSRHCGEPLSIIMLDVDYFKTYNDTHGHLAGDQALRTVAHTIQANLRPGDMSVRYGGEEFLAILPACDLGGARIVGERLRLAVSAAVPGLENDQELPGVTVSLGVAQLGAEKSIEAFIDASDKALYRAKKNGRNRASD